MSRHTFGQMVSNRAFFAKLGQKRVIIRKICPSQQASQATRSSFRLGIPEAGRDRRQSCSQIGEHGGYQQGQLRQTLTALKGKDEVAMQTNHLFSPQRDLFNRPAVLIQAKAGARL